MGRLLCYCLCGVLSLTSLTVFAATKTIIVEPSDLSRTYSAGPMAYSDSRNWDIVADVPAGKARPKVPVTTTRGWGFPKFRDGLKSAIKITPARVLESAALAAMFAAVDWVLDPANNTIQKPSGVFQDGYPVSTTTSTIEPGYICANLPATETIGKVVITSPQNWGTTWAVVTVPAWTDLPAGYTAYNNNCTSSALGYYYSENPPSPGIQYPKSGAKQIGTIPTASSGTVTDADLDDFTSGITDPATAADIAPYLDQVPGSYDYPDTFTFDGPSSLTGEPVTTTSTDASTGTTTVTETTPSYSFDYSTNPLSITTTTTNTTTTYQNGVLIQTDVTTETPVVTETQPEIPTDCEFMPTVCAFLEWYKAPAPPPNDLDMPMIDQDFQKSYSGPSLSTVCPAPFTVATGAFGTLSIPVDALCELAGLIKYLVLSAAGLLAAFIISGTRRA